jgi:hypothetical protein
MVWEFFAANAGIDNEERTIAKERRRLMNLILCLKEFSFERKAWFDYTRVCRNHSLRNVNMRAVRRGAAR